MGFVELLNKRGLKGKAFRDTENPKKHRWVGTIAPLHYSSVLNGPPDTDVNFDVIKINNAKLDGWLAEGGDFHYTLGIPQGKTEDGWIGFGGRQAQHWILMKLRGIGYLHQPTRSWQGVGGNPTYNRSNLSQVKKKITVEGQEIFLATTATWADIWTTPGLGSVNLIIRVDSTQLRVDVMVNQIARDWIKANAPPTTPIGQTWFGLAFEIDYVDVPKLKKNKVEVNKNDDFTDDDDFPLTFETALDEFLGFMPIDKVTAPRLVVGQGPDEPPEFARLNKRYWLDTDNQFDGNHMLFTGAKVGILNGLKAGPLLFDPTFGPTSIADTADDVDWAPEFSSFEVDGYYGQMNFTGVNGSIEHQLGLWFDNITIPKDATINAAKITYQNNSLNNAGTPTIEIFVEDANNPPTWANQNNRRPQDTIDGGTTNSPVDWSGMDQDSSDTDLDTADFAALIQDRISAVNWTDGEAIRIAFSKGASADSNVTTMYDVAHATGPPPTLTIDYTEGGGGQTWPSPTKQMAHLLNR